MGNGDEFEAFRIVAWYFFAGHRGHRLQYLMLLAMAGWVGWYLFHLPRDINEFRRTKEWEDRVAQLALWGVTVVVAAGLFGYLRWLWRR